MSKRWKAATADPDSEVIAAPDGPADGAPEPVDPPATVAELIEEVAASVVPAARGTGAAKFGIEFGVRTRKDGSATLAEEPGKGAFRVFLEWTADD